MGPGILPISFSTEAVKQINEIINEKNISSNYSVRVGLKGGGCSASYLFGFDTKNTNDEIFFINGVNVLINKKHLMYVFGIEIDFETGEEGKGFTFSGKEL